MSRLTRRCCRMKARYIITVIILIGLSSSITWTQLGDYEVTNDEAKDSEHHSKGSHVAAKMSVEIALRLTTSTSLMASTVSTTNKPKAKVSQPIRLLTKESRSFTQVSDVEKQEYYEEFFKSNVFHWSDRKQKQSNNRFLLPVLFFDVGPNNLYRLFKETIPIAKAMDRTLIIPPFHRHPRMENYVKSKRVGRDILSQPDRVVEVPIFDEIYVAGLETNPAKSLDVKALRYLVAAEPMEEFVTGCADEPRTLLICGELDEKRRKGIKLFVRAGKIQFQNTVHVDSLSDVTEDKTWKVNLALANKLVGKSRCVGLAIGRKCLGSKEAWLKDYKKIAPFVRRPVPVKILAKKFAVDMMGGTDFLAIHWRYDQIDWNDMCKPNRPESAKKRNAQICNLASKLGTEQKALLQLGKKIVRYMRKRGHRRAYLAGPPQMNSTIHTLRSVTPGLYTLSDVIEYAETRSSSRGFFETNYAVSFLEQEICYLSKSFLASPLSSWSQSVLLDRMSESKEYESVLDVLYDGMPGLPKLTWLFPEGSFR